MSEGYKTIYEKSFDELVETFNEPDSSTPKELGVVDKLVYGRKSQDLFTVFNSILFITHIYYASLFVSFICFLLFSFSFRFLPIKHRKSSQLIFYSIIYTVSYLIFFLTLINNIGIESLSYNSLFNYYDLFNLKEFNLVPNLIRDIELIILGIPFINYFIRTINLIKRNS